MLTIHVIKVFTVFEKPDNVTVLFSCSCYLCAYVCVEHTTSDATIYRPNDIWSRYWPYRIVSISRRKILKFWYIVIVSILAKRRRCCLFNFFFVGNKSIQLWVFTFFKSVVIMHCQSLVTIPHICIKISKTDSTLIDRQNITQFSNHTGNNCSTQLTRRSGTTAHNDTHAAWHAGLTVSQPC